MSRFWRLGLLLGCGLWACGEGRSPRAIASSPSAAVHVAVAAAKTPDEPRLPEDPGAGARSEAQWREHLLEEERERKVLFDRRRLKQHQQVLASFREARKRYDGAKTAAALLELKRAWARSSGPLQQRIEKLDRWGNSSNLRDDYAALLQAFAADYPDARLLALTGSNEQLAAAERLADEHTKKIVDWLAYVEKAETELDD